MNYIDACAYCIADKAGENVLDDHNKVLYRIYAVLAKAKGMATTLEDVHNAWAAWTASYNEAHKSLIPFANLTEEVQELDRLYVEAIHLCS